METSQNKQFWQDLITNPDNSLNEEQIYKELGDYSDLMDRMTELTCYISGGLLSKPTYTIEVLKSQVDDEITKYCDELKNDILGILRANKIDKEVINEIQNL